MSEYIVEDMLPLSTADCIFIIVYSHTKLASWLARKKIIWLLRKIEYLMTGETLQIVQVRQFHRILSMTNGHHFVAICRYNTHYKTSAQIQ